MLILKAIVIGIAATLILTAGLGYGALWFVGLL